MKKVIIITGTPGTGKTEIAKELSLLLKKELISVSNFAKNKELLEKYDKKDSTFDVDPLKLSKELAKTIEKSENELIIEGHMSHFLLTKYVEKCIVCRTELPELRKRLEKRSYSEDKIRENLEAEAFETCSIEAREAGHTVFDLDTSGKIKENVKKALKLLNS